MGVTLSTRVALALVLCSSPACGLAAAQPDADEVAMSGGTGDRVLGKRAFDAASAGYPKFERLASEAPTRTVARATARLDVLERELGRFVGPGDVDTDGASVLLETARRHADALDDAPSIAAAELAVLVQAVDAAQRALDDLRERRVRGG